MKWLAAVTTALLFLVSYSYANPKKAKTLYLKEGETGDIKTAPGFSTILQFDARPTSVVVGDQDAFKVEYVGDGLTLKPLMPGVKSNLFVFTEYDRFNFRLVSTSSDQADYLVKVNRGQYKPVTVETLQPTQVSNPGIPGVRERKLGKTVICSPLSLTLDKLGVPTSGNYLVLTFQLRYSGLSRGQEVGFSPGDIEILQAKRLVPIENLYLDGMAFSRAKPVVRGTLILKRSDLKPTEVALAGFTAPFVANSRCLRASFQPVL
jgi:hypothetical protein